MTPTLAKTSANKDATLVFQLAGQVGSADFPPWIARHAQKLGLAFEITEAAADIVTVHAVGPQDMLDAFALACSLGPHSVCVENLLLPHKGG